MVAFIDQYRDQYGVEPVCKALPIAPSTCIIIRHLKRTPERRRARAKRDYLTKPIGFGALQNLLFDTQAIQPLPKKQELKQELKQDEEKGQGLFIRGVNFGNAIDSHGGDLDFLHTLIGDFVEIYGKADAQFTNFLRAQDIEQADRLIHNIAGLSGTFGAEGLMLVAKKVGKELQAENEDCEENIEKF